MKTLDERMQACVDDAPTMYRGIYRKALMGVSSPRQDIKAMCQRCMGWESTSGSLADEIARCASRTCPLFAYRPGADGSQPSEGSDGEDFKASEDEKGTKAPSDYQNAV